MQLGEAVVQRPVGRGPAVVEAQIVVPGRGAEALGPDGNVVQIAGQDPAARAVAALRAPALQHQGEEGFDLIGRDPVLDLDGDRPAARLQIEAERGRLEILMRRDVGILALVDRQEKAEKRDEERRRGRGLQGEA